MRNNRIYVLFSSVLVIALLVLGVAAACAGPSTVVPTSPVSTSAVKILKIGGIYSLTGLGSEVEIVIRNGALLCQDWINKEKGGLTIKGQKYNIELVVEDQKGIVEGAVGAATKLIERDNVKFITGQIVPDVVMAAASVTEPAKVVRSTNAVGIPAITTPDTAYTFRAAPTIGPEQIQTNYDYLRDAYKDVKRVALISPDEPGGQFFMAISEAQAKAHGFEVVAKEFHDPQEQQNYSPVWTKVLASKPDAVDIGTGFPIPSSLKLKQGRELGFKGPIFAMSPVELYTIREIAGNAFSTDFFNSSLDIQSPDVPATIKDMQKRWEGKYKERFMFESAQGWDALWALVQAIEKAQSIDPTEVKTAWETMTKIETSYGSGSMGGLKTYGVNHTVVRPSPISVLDGGKVKLVKWYTPSIP